MPYEKLEDALAWHNAVPQGLSSAIFTNDLREAGVFPLQPRQRLRHCHVNIGTSGAEIGGAFGRREGNRRRTGKRQRTPGRITCAVKP